MKFKIKTSKLLYQDGIAKVRIQLPYVVGPFSAGADSANFDGCAKWPNPVDSPANVTTVGSNGGPSAYGTYDQNGNVFEWNDLTAAAGSSRGIRGGNWGNDASIVSSAFRSPSAPSNEDDNVGFRLASSFSSLNPLNLSHFTLVGDINNSNDTTGYGDVSYEYLIAQYPVTNCEYAEFLNAVASTDSYGLYNASMGSEVRGGITRSGSSGSYSYSVEANMGNKPVVFVSWFDAARYCNWLHNGKPTGSQNNSTTEDGAYTIPDGRISGDAVAKNANASYSIPTENEWYKAAFYKGGGTNAGYWSFATQSNSITCVSATSNGDGPVTSNYSC